MRRWSVLALLIGAGCVEASGGEPDVEQLCHNGTLDPGEECDAELTSDRSIPPASCTSTCRFNVCGDGELLEPEDCEFDPADPAACPREISCDLLLTCGDGEADPGEECDPSAPGSRACSDACALCGNGVLDEPEESCDPATASFCALDCPAEAACGNGLVERGEECEPSLDPTSCTAQCRLRGCGDGIVDAAAGERCDPMEGGLPSLGSCTAACQLGSCGDGELAPDEPCDGAAGCSAECALPSCGAVALVDGWEVTAWRTSEGRWVATGRDHLGQQGGPSPRGEVTVPASIDGLSWARLSISGDHGAGLLPDGRLFAWGANKFGLTGTVDGATSPPTPVAPQRRFVDVAVVLGAAAAVDVDGHLLTWGVGVNGLLGGGPDASVPCDVDDRRCRLVPVAIGPADVRFVAVDGITDTFVARDDAGRLWGWAQNDVGQLGADPVGCEGTTCPTPILLEPPGVVSAHCAGSKVVVAIVDGRLQGQGLSKQLGYAQDGTHRTFEPVPLPPGEDATRFVSVACGDLTALALDEDGRVFAFGGNGEAGILGLPGLGNVEAFGFPALPLAARAIDVGFRHAAALLVDGSIFTWGDGGYGRLGLADNANHDSPQPVPVVCP